MQDQDWRDLCWEAMHEKDVNKLLIIFLELDRATEGKQLMEVFTEAVREYRQIGQEEDIFFEEGVKRVAAATSTFRVLVVEDYEPFRQFIRSRLGQKAELQIVCEVSDGLDAVRKAEELHPDLILLDVGLPTLNGIEAARRIRNVSPKSKILFLSQESSADVVQELLLWGL